MLNYGFPCIIRSRLVPREVAFLILWILSCFIHYLCILPLGKHTWNFHRPSFENFLDHFVCFCDSVLAIYRIHAVYKVLDYSWLLLCITSFCLSPHGPHTVYSECDERQWMIDAHRASTHLLCSSGGVLRDAQPLWEVPGCGKLQLGRNVETLQLSNSAFTSITSSLGLFLQPHQTVLRRGLFTGKGSRWAPLGFWLSWNLAS